MITVFKLSNLYMRTSNLTHCIRRRSRLILLEVPKSGTLRDSISWTIFSEKILHGKLHFLCSAYSTFIRDHKFQLPQERLNYNLLAWSVVP